MFYSVPKTITMASGTKPNVFVDEKKFTHYYKNLSFDWSFYILTNAEFDKPVAFPKSRISHKRTAYDYRVGFLLKPIGTSMSFHKKTWSCITRNDVYETLCPKTFACQEGWYP